ncbi:MAG TPA: hypothetical protein VGX23_30830 [Actinocrinis sp.]|nr:hypothetical protein [Actinocrinis sp.]
MFVIRPCISAAVNWVQVAFAEPDPDPELAPDPVDVWAAPAAVGAEPAAVFVVAALEHAAVIAHTAARVAQAAVNVETGFLMFLPLRC